MNSTCFSRRLVEYRREVALDLQRRARSLLERRVHFVGDNVSQRRFAQPRRSVEEHVVEWLAARTRRLDGDLEVVFDFVLPDELAQPLWTQLQLERRIIVHRHSRDDAVGMFSVWGQNHDGAIVKGRTRSKQPGEQPVLTSRIRFSRKMLRSSATDI